VSQSKQLTVPAGEGRLDITPDGRLLAWTPNPPAAASLQVLDTSRGATVKSIPLPVSPDAFALSASGQWLMYLLGDHLHEIPLDGGPATEIVVPQAPCCEMELSAAGSELLLASAQEGRVMLYDLDKRKVRRTLQMRDRIDTVNFVPSTDDVVAVTFDGDVHLWKPSTTEEPRRLGTVEGHVTGVGFTRSGSTVLVSSDRGEMGWFSLGGVDRGQLATTTWLESTHSWLTVANDGRFEVTGDISTPLGILEAEHSTWQPASQLPGFTPGLLKQLAARY
jgi:WD40 repeat protein